MSLTSGNVTQSAGVPVNIVRGTHPLLTLFLVLNVWPSHFGLPILLAIILLSKKVKRHPTFVNLCVGFIIIGISSSLLLYAGKTTGPEPSKTLCLLQASLIYAVPPFSSLMAFMLVLQMFLAVRATHQKQASQGPHTIRLWAMLVIPYVVFFSTVLATAVIGSTTNPNRISRNRRFFYCSVDSIHLTNMISIFAALFCFATVVFEVWTLVILYKNFHGRGGSTRGSIDLNLPIRVMAFGLYVIGALGLSLLSIWSPQSPVPDLVIASAATVTILIFATQPDILHAACFWRKEPTPAFGGSSEASLSSYSKA
ncbi:hypothetical protein C8J57DRAFT_1292619 [Mycena rebaudengoi]|nr:hypothetical protein C8J57DRAFT_1292619 [Mycena rebaudengoi]